MQNEPVVVETVSQRKCVCCQQPGSFSPGTFSNDLHPVCASCGAPFELGPEETYFSVFGVSECFEQDRTLLEKKFYQISKALHPDRFTHKGELARNLSLKRMSFVNQAYGVLRNPEKLRQYILELRGFSISDSQDPSAILMGPAGDLAEAWFELQERMLESPQRAPVDRFTEDLNQMKELVEKNIHQLEKEYDQLHSTQQNSSAVLQKMVKEIQTQNYLKSLERNLANISSVSKAGPKAEKE